MFRFLNTTTRACIPCHLSQRSHRYFCSTKKSLLPPTIQPLLENYYLLVLLKATLETGILDRIPVCGTNAVGVDQICADCETCHDLTYKTLRFMSSMGFTKETMQGYFVHTDKSLDVLPSGNAHHTLNLFMDSELCAGRLRFGHYLKGQTFADIHGKRLLDFLQADVHKRETVSGALKEITESELLEAHHFDLGDAKYATMIDLGGGIGELMLDVCRRYPDKKCFVFERPHIVEMAKQHWLQALGVDVDHTQNLAFIAGDLFNEGDIVKHCSACDVIIMKRVVHDFNDEQCAKVLSAVHTAMKARNNPHGVLLICDLVLNDTLNDSQDVGAKMIDFEFGFLMNWKERRLSQFDALFGKHGFKRIQGYPRPFGNIHITAFQAV